MRFARRNLYSIQLYSAFKFYAIFWRSVFILYLHVIVFGMSICCEILNYSVFKPTLQHSKVTLLSLSNSFINSFRFVNNKKEIETQLAIKILKCLRSHVSMSVILKRLAKRTIFLKLVI